MKKIALLAIACIAGSAAFSQSFIHALGFAAFIDHTSGSGSLASGAITYSPRFNLMENDYMTVSVGIPLSVGGSGGSGSGDGYYVGDDYYYYDDDYNDEPHRKSRAMWDIPVIVNLNFGGLSSKKNKKAVGFFVGGGLGYHYGPVNLNRKDENGNKYIDSTTQSSFGPVGNIGLRVRLSKRSDEGLELKGSYMKSVSKRQPDIYGIVLLFII